MGVGRRILVMRIGAFGDVCMLAPLVRSLARRHEVHWLIHTAYEPVIHGFSGVHCRLLGVSPGVDPDRPFPLQLVESLRRERYDCLVDCSHWACSGWLANQLLEVPVRATTHDPLQDSLLAVDRGPLGTSAFNCVVPTVSGGHQTAKWRRLFREALGFDATAEWELPDRRPLLPDEPLEVFLHAHAGKPEKIWPIGRFTRLLADLARRRRVHCTVNGVRRRIVRGLRLRLLASRVRLSVSPFDSTFAALRDTLSRSHLAIGCDSGPMHFASLLGVPSLVLYGRYPAAEFAPPWRSTAVEPPPGHDVDALPIAAAAAALDRLIGRIERPNDPLERAA